MYDCISWINRNYKKTGRSTFEKVSIEIDLILEEYFNAA